MEPSVVVYTQQTIRLGKGWTGELSGFYTSPSVYQGTFKGKELWSPDGGLSKNVLHDQATIKASVSDIFNTMHWAATSDFAGQNLQVNGHPESRQLKLYFTWRFGNTRVKAAQCM